MNTQNINSGLALIVSRVVERMIQDNVDSREATEAVLVRDGSITYRVIYIAELAAAVCFRLTKREEA